MGADELEKMTTNALALRDTFDCDVAEHKGSHAAYAEIWYFRRRGI